VNTYERSVRVAAPFERVWDFHSRVDGLEGLTPDWMGLRVEQVLGPDGESDPDVLESGAELHLSTAIAGIGPRQEWVSAITERERHDGAAYFRDEMREGPFPEWLHTHLFYRDGDETIVRDRVRYELPGGGLGRRLGPLAVVGFAPMFRYRHRRTRELLEGA
jgi:ligand-binding SRPBCC domain-containing protein